MWAEIATPAGMTPIPVVLINSLSAAPRWTTFVSPVTICTPAFLAAACILSATRRKVSTASPSSKITLQVRYNGLAPLTAKSLTVPLMANSPISPPGKNKGSTT